MKPGDEKVEIAVDELVHETEMAWLFRIDDQEVWLPKSKCDYDDGDATVMVPQWLVEAKRLA